MSRTPGYRVRHVGTLADQKDDVGSPPGEEVETTESEPGGLEPAAAGDAATAELADVSASPAAPVSPVPEELETATVAGSAGSGESPVVLALARRPVLLAAVAALGVAGTIGFGLAWALGSSGGGQNAAVTTSARNLVLALTNFDPGTVSADFSRVQQDATGSFATQAKKVFGSTIRKELSSADAASRGKINDLYVESVSGSHASVFAVVSQTYLNSKTASPVKDTVRMVIGLQNVGGSWKASSVKVLEQPAS